jgi:hypothetical protein
MGPGPPGRHICGRMMRRGVGTLYTAVYRPADLAVEYRWRDSSWPHSIGSLTSGQHEAVLG